MLRLSKLFVIKHTRLPSVALCRVYHIQARALTLSSICNSSNQSSNLQFVQPFVQNSFLVVVQRRSVITFNIEFHETNEDLCLLRSYICSSLPGLRTWEIMLQEALGVVVWTTLRTAGIASFVNPEIAIAISAIPSLGTWAFAPTRIVFRQPSWMWTAKDQRDLIDTWAILSCLDVSYSPHHHLAVSVIRVFFYFAKFVWFNWL